MKIAAIVAAGALIATGTSAVSAASLFHPGSSNGYTLVNVPHSAASDDDDLLNTTGVFSARPTAAALQKTIAANPGLEQALRSQGVDPSGLEAISVLPGHVVAYTN
ncbi:hypothetical protein [Consotaella aegiceratis]|uniref:hypothetical protein n=1 Tax=Consotaella aegiceratis TaxID=3097961 RepID=UPI002F414D80